MEMKTLVSPPALPWRRPPPLPTPEQLQTLAARYTRYQSLSKPIMPKKEESKTQKLAALDARALELSGRDPWSRKLPSNILSMIAQQATPSELGTMAGASTGLWRMIGGKETMPAVREKLTIGKRQSTWAAEQGFTEAIDPLDLRGENVASIWECRSSPGIPFSSGGECLRLASGAELIPLSANRSLIVPWTWAEKLAHERNKKPRTQTSKLPDFGITNQPVTELNLGREGYVKVGPKPGDGMFSSEIMLTAPVVLARQPQLPRERLVKLAKGFTRHSKKLRVTGRQFLDARINPWTENDIAIPPFGADFEAYKLLNPDHLLLGWVIAPERMTEAGIAELLPLLRKAVQGRTTTTNIIPLDFFAHMVSVGPTDIGMGVHLVFPQGRYRSAAVTQTEPSSIVFIRPLE